MNIKWKALRIKMAKNTAHIEMWEQSVRSEYQRKRRSRENTQPRRSVDERERREREKNRVLKKIQITVKHLHENNCVGFRADAA